MLLKKNSSGLLNPETWSKDAYKAMWVEGKRKKINNIKPINQVWNLN